MSRFALGLATLTLVLVTGACDDDPEPKIADPTTDPPTSEPTSEPPTPSAEPQPLSPEQTVREWVDGWNELSSSGDPSRVRRISTERCSTCTDLTSPTVQVYRDGGSIVSEGWSIAGLKRQPDFTKTSELVALVDFASGVTVPAKGEAPTEFPAEKHALTFTLSNVGNEWLVAKVVFLS